MSKGKLFQRQVIEIIIFKEGFDFQAIFDMFLSNLAQADNIFRFIHSTCRVNFSG